MSVGTDNKYLQSVGLADLVLIVTLSASLLGNVALGWMVKGLLTKHVSVASSDGRTGMRFPDLKLTDPSGHVATLRFRKDKSTIVYIFRPGCRWCAANIENIRSLNRQSSQTIDFIGVSTTRTGLYEYVKQTPLPFPIYALEDTSELSVVSFVGTPQTISISSEGIVEDNWVGAYSGETEASIEKRFHVTLPGMVSVPTSN